MLVRVSISRRGISPVVTSIIVCAIVIASVLLLYILSMGLIFHMSPSPGAVSGVGSITVLGYRSGPGYLVYYVTTKGEVTIYDIVIKTPDGSVACIESFPGGLKLSPGKVNTIPVIGTLLHCKTTIPNKGYALFVGSSSIVATSPLTDFTSVKNGLIVLKFAYFEDEVARSNDRLYVDLSSDYWDSILIYPFGSIYAVRCKGSQCGTIWTKTTTVLPIGQNVLDIKDMTLEQRYDLGPIVVVINPTYATQEWTFKIIDALGNVHV
ncbi:MAG: hypothetical protein GXO23_07725, partial [Crenarchaeota archaeon]|nr:hypothetical protein [Thermoproteota archaeon]